MKKRICRILTVFTVVMIPLALTACSSNTDSKEHSLNIVATLFPQYDFAKQITGDNADVTMLLTPGSESHAYEPTPKDISIIQKADIFLYVGGESEVWVDDLLESAGNEDLRAVKLMDYITPIEQKHEEGEKHEEEYDEHIFTSLKNSRIILDEICNVICEEDAEKKDVYRQNTMSYSEKISSLDAQFEEMISASERKTAVFGDRFPFAYFANDYDLECYAAFSGCSSETEASPATLSKLINFVKSENIPVVFYIEFSSQAIADKIADAAGVKTALMHSCHNISKEDMENGVSYVDLMTNNYQVLSEALN